MFVARESELKELSSALSGTNRAVMIYGKRKVGKTTLIKYALQRAEGKSIYYECVKTSLEENLRAFTEELVRNGVLPVPMQFSGFNDLFSYLNTIPGIYHIVIDEYPYLKAFEEKETIDSLFQTIIDNRLSNVNLILSGSHVGMMRDLTEEKSPLYGRFHTVIHLKELNYLECSDFYPLKTAYEKVAFYSVFGGSPFVNEQLDPELSLKENILNTVLNEKSSVYLYADNMLLSEYAKRSEITPERILSAIGNGSMHYSEIERALSLAQNGGLSKHLKLLEEMDLIQKSWPINQSDNKKKTTYSIIDNVMRFFYTFVNPNRSALQMIGREGFYQQYIEPVLTQFISRRFEEICRTFFSLQARRGVMKGIRNIGTFHYDDPSTKTSGQFDVALETTDGFVLFEVKYLQKPLTLDEIHREVSQVRKIPGLPVQQIGFISVNGVEEKEPGYLYYDGADLYGRLDVNCLPNMSLY